MARQQHSLGGEFDREQEDWDTYVEWVEIYLAANDIKDNGQKKAVLLSVCGPVTYRKIWDLAAPKKPADLSYEDIIQIGQKHYDPKRGVVVHRFKLNSRLIQQEETVADYVAALRHLAIHYNYGDSLDDMLHDRIMCGINNAAIQRHLLAESDIDCDKALKIAKSMEIAKEDSEHLGVGRKDRGALVGERVVHKTSGGRDYKTKTSGCCNKGTPPVTIHSKWR